MFLVEFSIDDRVPDGSGTECGLKVYPSTICHGESQLDQTHLLFKSINNLNVFDVIVDKLLVVLLI